MGHFARQNESFCSPEWAVLKCKMSHFESSENVKKIQVVCFQRFKTLSYFACTRPSDFYFGKTVLTEAKKALSVRFFHNWIVLKNGGTVRLSARKEWGCDSYRQGAMSRLQKSGMKTLAMTKIHGIFGYFRLLYYLCTVFICCLCSFACFNKKALLACSQTFNHNL